MKPGSTSPRSGSGAAIAGKWAAGSAAEQAIMQSASAAFPAGAWSGWGQCCIGIALICSSCGAAAGAADMPSGISRTATRASNLQAKLLIAAGIGPGSRPINDMPSVRASKASN